MAPGEIARYAGDGLFQDVHAWSGKYISRTCQAGTRPASVSARVRAFARVRRFNIQLFQHQVRMPTIIFSQFEQKTIGCVMLSHSDVCRLALGDESVASIERNDNLMFFIKQKDCRPSPSNPFPTFIRVYPCKWAQVTVHSIFRALRLF